MLSKYQLLEVRKLIENPDHWVGGKHQNFESDKPAYCLTTACTHIIRMELWDEVWHLLGFDNMYQIWRWNDAPERTHSEVLACLDAGIEKAPV